MALADFQQLVMDMVSDQAKAVTPDVRDRAIERARVRYSTDLPRTLVGDVLWPALGVFGPVPADWSDVARVQSAEYPIGQRPAAHVYVDAYRTPTGWGLECVQALPEGAMVRIAYTVPHALDAGADSVPQEHRLPVAQYAAHLLCQQLAARYSGERDAAVGGDVARTESRARNFAARAKEYRAAYYEGTGQADPFAAAAGSGGGNGLAPAAAVTSWPGRRRNQPTRGAQ